MEIEQLENQSLSASIEAILFAHGEPLEIKKITKILNQTEEAIKEALNSLIQEYENKNRGLRIIFQEEGKNTNIQLVTKPEFSKFLEEFIKAEFQEQLTPATLDTLSLIAYLGPISRSQIDYFRGVNSSFIIRNLLMRGLIDRVSESSDRGYSYQVSFDFLKHLGISNIKELPDYNKYRELSLNFQSTEAPAETPTEIKSEDAQISNQ